MLGQRCLKTPRTSALLPKFVIISGLIQSVRRKHLFLKHGIRFNKKAAEFYLRCLCSVSEPLAAQQSNAPAIPNDIKIITTIKTTPFKKTLIYQKIVS
jgi:hypothetical protein